MKAFVSLLCGVLTSFQLASAAHAACPIELATYADKDKVAEINFTPGQGGATVANTFRMLLGNDVVLDGIVQWTEGVARSYGMLTHKCPDGDVTGEEYAACTVWQGVIYASDDQGNITLMPNEGVAAPRRLIFADLGPALRNAQAFGPKGLEKLPFDVFEMNGCQE